MSGATRLAEAMLRTLGRSVLLRVPKPAMAGDLGEQTGLAQPQFQDSELGPAVLRKTGELLVAAPAIARLAGATAGSAAPDSVQILFNNAAGIVIDGLLYPVKSLSSAEAFGQVYLWRIQLQRPLRQGGQA